MRVVSWNVNGLRAIDRKGLFVPMIESLKPDILCLQETKAKRHQSPIDLPEYYEIWNDAERPGYSGTAIFTTEKPLSVSLDFPQYIIEKHALADDGFGNPNEEGRLIAAEYPAFILVNVYTPNSKPNLERLPLRYKKWDPAFRDYCLSLQEKKPLIICGDFNVAHTAHDLARPKANEGNTGFTPEEREGIDRLIADGFIDTFRLFHTGNGYYTWWSHWGNARARNVGWRIDYILVSKILKKTISYANIHPDIMGSDHCPVSADFTFSSTDTLPAPTDQKKV